MARQNAYEIQLFAGNGGEPETFLALGGMTLTRLVIVRRPVAGGYLGDEGWRHLLSSAGEKSISLSGQGEFDGSAGEERARSLSFSGEVSSWKLDFVSGGMMTVPGVISHYERVVDSRNTLTYRISIQSAGEGVYTAA